MIARLLVTFLFLNLTSTLAFPADSILLGGKQGSFMNFDGTAKDNGRIVFAGDGVLKSTYHSPLCPTVTKVRLSTPTQPGTEVTLDCALWRASGSSFRYSDPAGTRGGIRSIVYQPPTGRLVVRLKGAGYVSPVAPVQAVDFRIAFGAAGYCGRFRSFKRNVGSKIQATAPTVACTVGCGNGITDGTEQCDDGNTVSGDGCDANCKPTGCGNGILTTGEECDDGNTAPGDGCRTDCSIETCGDGTKDPQEACDDGNTANGDCCTGTCGVEPVGSACTSDDNVCTDDVCVAGGVCAHQPNDDACNDENACTTGDVCSAGVCGGDPVAPWINELDYDGGSTGGTPDKDEMVEIAAPAGTDLSGYQLVVVEGNQTCATGLAANGAANLTATIPAGTVVEDETGSGIGFLVACFANTSQNRVLAGDCDVVLPGPSSDSNVSDGHLLNLDKTSCPDGVALVDPVTGVIDAVSYEGVVPNTGAFGAAFNVTPYNAGQDQGAKLGVALEKTSSNFGRATTAAEWRLTGGCVDAGPLDSTCVENSSSPGEANPGQAFQCATVLCGDGVVAGPEECDEGDANSDDPDATCRTDCTAQRCGDAIVDPGAGEECEATADCAAGYTCRACGCLTDFNFTVVPGPSEGAPADDGQSTWLRISPLFGMTNATQGDFNPGPLKVARSVPGANGKADLVLLDKVYLGAQLPSAAGEGRVCFRIEQDPNAMGEIDCDGGTNYDVFLTVDSGGTGAAGPTALTVGTGSASSGAGAGVLRVLLFGATTSSDSTPCTSASYVTPPTRTAITTGVATSEITNTRQGGSTTVSLTGKPFSCSSWTSDGPASIAMPNVSLDFVLPFNLGTQDVAQVLRLNDQ